MKQIYVGRDRVDAEMASEALRNIGFNAVVIGDQLAIPTGPYPSVWVEDDEEEAAKVAWAELQGAAPQ